MSSDPGSQDLSPEIIQANLPTNYNGSKVCPRCGQMMSPVQVAWGRGLCPRCSRTAAAEHSKTRMAGHGREHIA